MQDRVIRGDLAELIVDTMAEGVCLVRVTDATIVHASPRFTGLLGYGTGALDGKPVASLSPEQSIDDARPTIAQITGTGAGIHDVVVRHEDASPVWCRARTTTHRHAELGEVQVVLLKDIEAEKRLQRSEEVLRTVAEQLPVGLWITDEHGVITYGNPAGRQIWRGARFVGVEKYGEYRGWWVDTGQPIAAPEWALARALQRRETSIGEVVRIQCFDGSYKTMLNSAAPLIGEGGELFGAVVVNQDITSLQEAIRARDEVLAVVAHDLRGPVHGIGLRASALIEELGELAPPDSQPPRDGMDVPTEAKQGSVLAGRLEIRHRAWLDGIVRAVAEISRHIEDLLDVARLERGTLELAELDVGELIVEALERSMVRAEGRQLQCERPVRLPSIMADRRRLLQVLDNLIGNAIKFTGQNDQITVGATEREGELHLWVADTGPGLAPEHLAMVFERSWQADPDDRRGVGLGLAIVHDIVQAHGGRAWATSEPGRGATFHVALPLGNA